MPGTDRPGAEIGRPVAVVTSEAGVDLDVLRALQGELPRVFAGADEFEQWRQEIAQEFAELRVGSPEGVLAPIEVDDASDVVVADVDDACDAARRFVAGDPSTIVSTTFDETPLEENGCGVPALTLVVSVVPREEIDASAPGAVEVSEDDAAR